MIFLCLVVTVALLSIAIVRGENGREWKQYQRAFKEFCANAPVSNAGLSPKEEERRLKTFAELAATKIQLNQIFLPEANTRDLCTTCHLGIDSPLFEDAPQPFRTHSGKTLEQHKADRFGCTLCHHGLGVGTTTEAAHGLEENWPEPLLPMEYVQSTCAGCHETSFMLDGAEKLEKGRQLFAENGCYACHAAQRFEGLPKVAGELNDIGTDLSNASWLFAWLRDPSSLRPQTRMPNFKLSETEVGDLAAFLWSQREEVAPKKISLRGASAEQGERTFVNRGCRGCHSVTKDEPGASPRVPNLSSVGLKLTPEWIASWLDDPRAHNPDSRMPKPVLSDEERLNLTAYLMTLKANADLVKPDEQPDIAQFDAENGKKLVQLYGCYGCHTIKGFEQLPQPGIEVSEVAHKTLDDLPFGDSTVARTKWDWVRNKIKTPRIYAVEDMPLRMPEFTLNDADTQALATFYLNNAPLELPARFVEPATPRIRALQAGDRLITAYNCRGCHMLEAEQDAVIAKHLELKSMIPPRLIGEGEKVQPQWLYQFLSAPTNLRPWLQIRMPDFGFSHENAEALVNYFSERAADSGITFPYLLLPSKATVSQEDIEMGGYRVSTDKCVQCHPVTLDTELPEDVNLADLSINLMLAKNRLRFEWIKDFLRNPDQYAGAGTKMPFVYYDPAGKPKIPDPELWIDLTAKFLMVMEELPEPVEEALEEIRPGSDVDWSNYDY